MGTATAQEPTGDSSKVDHDDAHETNRDDDVNDPETSASNASSAKSDEGHDDEPLDSKPDGGTKTKKSTMSAEERERDQELVRLIQRGDRAAFRELFDRYHRRAFAVAFGVVKNQQDALDVVQEAFIKVHKHIQNFQGTSSFYTWLYRIVMNLSIDHVRRAKKGRNVDYDDRVRRDEDDVAGDGAILPSILGANPRRTVLRKELSESIQAALDELPEYHQAVILLREVEGLSYEEMSKVLGVPKGTIMSRLFHARRKMQESLAEYLGGELDLQT